MIRLGKITIKLMSTREECMRIQDRLANSINVIPQIISYTIIDSTKEELEITFYKKEDSIELEKFLEVYFNESK